MFIAFFKKIPFVISALALVNVIGIKIIESTGVQKPEIIKFLFTPETPLYFNYWLIYVFCAIVIAIILTIMRKYSILEAISSVGINLILFFVIFIFTVKRM